MGWVPVRNARTSTLFAASKAGFCGGVTALAVLLGTTALQNATANGDTRTISFHHIHLKEDTTITYKVNGRYDQAALQKVNHALRDWRTGQPTNMDPHLIDALWEVYRETGAQEPIHVIGGYRSPATNSMLRKRSSGVARHSQHMNGKAIDFYIPGVELASIRDAGLRVQRGGVGFYPSSGAPFVHMDTGSVRHWPRIPEAQLARIMAKGPLTQVASRSKTKATVVAARNVPDEDTEVARPAPRRVTASVAPARTETAPTPAAVVPMPKNRPVATPEPAPSGFSLASATSQPARPARTAPEAAPTGFNLASATSQPARTARPSQAASLVNQQGESANDIINQRGYWQGMIEPERPTPPADIPNARLASAENPITGSVAMPWPMPDRRQAADSMAYAPANAAIDAQPAPKGRTVARIPAPRTTVAARSDVRQAKQDAPKTGTVKVGQRFDNPWMRAMMVAPNAQDFMSTSLYGGGPDIGAIRQNMQKPTTTVMMTFSADPHLGMTTEQFRGSAVVFVSTVTFRQRTAALR
jgi:uncharacterized protein YcbK (DUF882 family)